MSEVATIPVTRAQSTVTWEAADALVHAGIATAAEMGVPQVVAIVDPGGTLVALGRQDGAPLVAVDLAVRKAHTAARVGKSTQELWDFISDDPELVVGLAGDAGMVAVGGGIPLRIGGQTIGAVGVSGGYYREDIEVAQAVEKALEGL